MGGINHPQMAGLWLWFSTLLAKTYRRCLFHSFAIASLAQARCAGTNGSPNPHVEICRCVRQIGRRLRKDKKGFLRPMVLMLQR
jgi:hypothetical protein